ncbi:MAG TPA: hypothetical protein VII58_06855 [Acidobacteriaceae bacterium]
MAMTAAEKTTYVMGFIDGWNEGASERCLAEANRPGPPWPHEDTMTPEGACMADGKHFTRGVIMTDDVSAYTSVIDAFYSHSECRMMPYPVLLEHLDDAEYKPGEEFYQFVRSGPPWGAFSIEGVDKCYGAAQSSSSQSR